ncbi:MAG TPA: RIP metalloprotease RseP [Bryobacteraceae bacterium]|nr:RIP metalloprotease RseP [Bryobacteraceae bacterium]
MAVVQNIWWLLVLIGVMILVHELGHYWAARFFDVRVETFSFGFGPRIFGFRKGETDFRFSAILFGGYVKMAGEQPGDESVTDPRGFLAKPRWQRLAIAFAGPLMNIVLAIALLTGLFMFKYPKPVESDLSATVGHVLPDSAAAKAGIRDGDRIVKIGDLENPTWQDILVAEASNARRPIKVVIERDGRRIDCTVTPVLLEKLGIGFAGWAEQAEIQVGEVSPGMPAEKAGLRRGDLLLSANGEPIRSQFKLREVVGACGGKPVEIEFIRDGLRQRVTVQPEKASIDGPERWMIGVGPEQRVVFSRLPFVEALAESVHHNTRGATLIYQVLRGIVERRLSAKTLDGPIRIAQLSGDAARQGAYSFIMLMAAVSLNLAILNLLPIPVLDGGVILMLLVEMVMRRDLSLPIKEAVFKLGFVFLLGIMVFVIYNDIVKVLPPG